MSKTFTQCEGLTQKKSFVHHSMNKAIPFALQFPHHGVSFKYADCEMVVPYS